MPKIPGFQDIFNYLSVLSIIEPARVQDIIEASETLLPKGQKINSAKQVHEYSREKNYVLDVRRGVYVVSRRAWPLFREGQFSRELDNRRFFAIKEDRKKKRR